MKARLRSLTLGGVLILSTGCVAPRAGGAPHPDFNTEMAVQVLADIDYLVTNYSWLLALFGL